METSKAYFEDILRRFETERRGRTLFQFCRDEAVEYKDLMACKLLSLREENRIG